MQKPFCSEHFLHMQQRIKRVEDGDRGIVQSASRDARSDKSTEAVRVGNSLTVDLSKSQKEEGNNF